MICVGEGGVFPRSTAHRVLCVMARVFITACLRRVCAWLPQCSAHITTPRSHASSSGVRPVPRECLLLLNLPPGSPPYAFGLTQVVGASVRLEASTRDDRGQHITRYGVLVDAGQATVDK